ncbi:MAG: GAF domain-containing protein [Myxacorys californica WJT36-NPBG1]|nr:GAF domain-containing protein [Myxacorys californica WJT36-NPBG1]
MQARISRSQPELQEVIGRVMDSLNPREDILLVQSDYVPLLSSYPVEPTASHSLSSPSSHSSLEVMAARRLMQVVATAAPVCALFSLAETLSQTFSAAGCVISVQASSTVSEQLIYWFSNSQIATTLPEIVSHHHAISAEGNLEKIAARFEESTDVFTLELQHGDSSGTLISLATQCQGQTNAVVSLLRGSQGSLMSVSDCSPGYWTEAEVNTFNTIADQVAVAISQILLQQRVHRQAQYQTLLRQVTLAIQNSAELPQITELAIRGTAQALGAERAFLLRLKYWDPRQSLRIVDRVPPKARVIVDCHWQHSSLELSSSEGLEAVLPLSQSFWASECVICQTALNSTEEFLTFSNKSAFPALTETTSIAPIFDPETMASLMLVPLESKSRLLGFIALQQRQPRTWLQEEVELVELVAAQVSSAILQKETLRQVESLVEERTAQLQQSLELQAKLYEITRRQIEKLREMNQRMDEFLSTLSHELRTPLTSMMLAIRMLREANLSPERRQQYLNILEQQCAQETSLINDLLALQELETKQVAFQFQQVNLNSAIQDLVQSFHQRWALKGLKLEMDLPPRSPKFNTDVASFNRILLELLTNAGKYADPNSTIFLKISGLPGQRIQVMLSNTGSGISEAELPHIFDKFRRCQGMTKNAVSGTGLGLALVKSLVQHLNGTITASSLPMDGSQSYETCFTILLPQNLDLGE